VLLRLRGDPDSCGSAALVAQSRDMEMSRRALLLAGTGLSTVRPSLSANWQTTQRTEPAGILTAARVLDRIKAHVGIPWLPQTVDNIVAGSTDTRVNGIATTMMATLDVVQRAAAAGRNMVITHEPTFYSHQDALDDIRDDPTYRFKRDFIERRGMVVFHFHDHWHRRTPDGIALGMAREVGWEKHLVPESPREFVFADRTLLDLARELESRLHIRTMRVVGDPAMKVRRALASWGYVSVTPGIPYIARPDVDVLVVGETREWEVVEYVQDQIASGKQKALIVLGHVLSEQAGMKYCAEWLRTFINEVPVEFVPATEPFWRPDDPLPPGGRAD
jgi:putative NIF3 family GTP cyclohydrolase 1 type 2